MPKTRYTRRGVSQRIRIMKRFLRQRACQPASYLLDEIVESGKASAATVKELRSRLRHCLRTQGGRQRTLPGAWSW
jgi:hypothetical protein